MRTLSLSMSPGAITLRISTVTPPPAEGVLGVGEIAAVGGGGSVFEGVGRGGVSVGAASDSISPVGIFRI
jgi:hypothetical protein